MVEKGARSPARSASPPAVDALQSLNRMAGNAAVGAVLARQPTLQAPPPVKPPAPMKVGKLGDPIEFDTKKAKLGDVEVHFNGPADHRGQRSRSRATPCRRTRTSPPDQQETDGARAAMGQGPRPRPAQGRARCAHADGHRRVIELDFLGRKLKLELARGFAGLPEFVINGEFAPPRASTSVPGPRGPEGDVLAAGHGRDQAGPVEGPAAPANPWTMRWSRRGLHFDGVAAELDDRLANKRTPATPLERRRAVPGRSRTWTRSPTS